MLSIVRIMAIAWLLVWIPSLAHAQLAGQGIIEAGGGGLATIQGMGSFATLRVRGFLDERVSAGAELQRWRDGYGRTLFGAGGTVFLDVVAVSEENRAVPYVFATAGFIALMQPAGRASGSAAFLVGGGFGLRFHVGGRVVISPDLRKTLPTGTGGQVSLGWTFR